MSFIIIIAVVVIVALIVVSMYNSLVREREMVRNAKGQIATQVESRWDAISSLIDATKSYEKHEDELLRDITKSRTGVGRNSDVKDFEAEENLFNQAMGRINVVAENYPNLKASDVYQNTMIQIAKFEDNVRHSRMIYNDTVTKYNTNIQSFPSSLVASAFNFGQEAYFENTKEKNEVPSWN
ncbi:LemA protein [Anaerosphaera aminiphila DSM 21120]|uniref:LemA protein n=1 Tax=Anaerosphaera aminiphila DSM 21120 TaxID=1120995 RepID=A0A1M5PR70_9FIRM|nr:LemA family protein [Anaerosphaera aminiphila]SHH04254.1 LemA protein [Anaerosphaera aminiphila DSM 21120]